jgi:poly-gamma-glutamate capsule biosynthesis protein CapA/YwtB (metallophosphatase superfamily)
VPSSGIAEQDVGADIIAHLRSLAVECFVISGNEGAREGERPQGRLQASQIAVDRERQLAGVVQELLVDARDFRVVVALQQNGGEYGSRDRDRKYEQQQVSPHGDAAYARTNVDQISPRA